MSHLCSSLTLLHLSSIFVVCGMPVTPAEFQEWQDRTRSLTEPTRGKYLALVAFGEDAFEEVAGLPEAALRATIESMAGMGAAGKQVVIAWFLNRAVSAVTDTVAHKALELAAEADNRGLVG